jgi:hypothetical protein
MDGSAHSDAGSGGIGEAGATPVAGGATDRGVIGVVGVIGAFIVGME